MKRVFAIAAALLSAATLATPPAALAQDAANASRCAPGSSGSTACRPGGAQPLPGKDGQTGNSPDTAAAQARGNGSDPNSKTSEIGGITGSPDGMNRGDNKQAGQ